MPGIKFEELDHIVNFDPDTKDRWALLQWIAEHLNFPSEFRTGPRKVREYIAHHIAPRQMRNWDADAWEAKKEEDANFAREMEGARKKGALRREKEAREAEIRMAIWDARKDKLYSDVSAVRIACYRPDEPNYRTHDIYASKQEVMDVLMSDDYNATHDLNLSGTIWHRQREPLTIAEIAIIWDPIHTLDGYKHKNSYVDYSLLGSISLLWKDVPKLEPMQQSMDAEGRVAYRTNAQSPRKLRAADQCLLEALLFATGKATLAELNVVGMGSKGGIDMHELFLRLKKTPFTLTSMGSFVKAKGGCKRGADGKERRKRAPLPALPTLLSLCNYSLTPCVLHHSAHASRYPYHQGRHSHCRGHCQQRGAHRRARNRVGRMAAALVHRARSVRRPWLGWGSPG
jgi:hypothetical protein